MKYCFEKYFPFQEWNNGAVDDFHLFIHEKLQPYEQESLLIITELNSASGITYFVIMTHSELKEKLSFFMEELESGLPYDDELLTIFGNLDLFRPD